MRGGESERLIIPILAAMNEKLDRILSIIDPSDPIALRFKEPHSIIRYCVNKRTVRVYAA